MNFWPFGVRFSIGHWLITKFHWWRNSTLERSRKIKGSAKSLERLDETTAAGNPKDAASKGICPTPAMNRYLWINLLRWCAVEIGPMNWCDSRASDSMKWCCQLRSGQSDAMWKSRPCFLQKLTKFKKWVALSLDSLDMNNACFCCLNCHKGSAGGVSNLSSFWRLKT